MFYNYFYIGHFLVQQIYKIYKQIYNKYINEKETNIPVYINYKNKYINRKIYK